jgi:hypothetical protein
MDFREKISAQEIKEIESHCAGRRYLGSDRNRL